jgi:carbonic anhydrase
LFIILSFASCSNQEKDNHSVGKAEDCTNVHWSYVQGEDGPNNWQNLCDGYSACGGEIQSPINIISSGAVANAELSPIKINYGSSNVDIVNNGHTVQFNVSGNSTATIGNKEYHLLQFHFHALSEHTIDGNHYPIEVHFVHKYSDTDFAVLGIMYEEGEANDLFSKYLTHFPNSKGSYTSEDSISVAGLIPSNLNYYNYNGSLTTPPCSEVVNWYVLKTPLEASSNQIENISEILHGNYRPVMPLNGRRISSFEE